MRTIFKNINYEKYYKELLPYLKKDKSKQYLTLIFTLGASIFFFLFAINPTVSTIVKLRKQISDAELVHQKLQEKILNLQNLSTQYQNLENDLQLINDAVPNNPEAPTLIAQLQSLGQQSNMRISNIAVSPINVDAPISTQSSTMNFELTGISTFDNLQKFLSDLTKMQRAISVNSMQVSKTQNGDQEIELIIQGSAYFKK
jgi:Tfp pilus assembly protein PilO